MLFLVLDDVAAQAMETEDMDDLEKEGGETLIYDILDWWFPDLAVHGRPGEALQEGFSIRPTRNEPMVGFSH